MGKLVRFTGNHVGIGIFQGLVHIIYQHIFQVLFIVRQNRLFLIVGIVLRVVDLLFGMFWFFFGHTGNGDKVQIETLTDSLLNIIQVGLVIFLEIRLRIVYLGLFGLKVARVQRRPGVI